MCMHAYGPSCACVKASKYDLITIWRSINNQNHLLYTFSAAHSWICWTFRLPRGVLSLPSILPLRAGLKKTLLPLTFQQVLWIHTQVVRLHIKTDTHEPAPHSTRHSSWECVCLCTKDGCVTIFIFYFFSAFPSLLLLYTIKQHELSPPPQS